jgi:hypothetical protein
LRRRWRWQHGRKGQGGTLLNVPLLAPGAANPLALTARMTAERTLSMRLVRILQSLGRIYAIAVADPRPSR